MKRSSSTSGFTLIELLISVALLSTAGLLMAGFLSKPAMIQNYITAADQERLVNNALNTMVNDLIEADPSSISWLSVFPNSAVNFSSMTLTKTTYDSTNSSVTGQTVVAYSFVPDASGVTGSVLRTTTIGGATPTSTTSTLLNRTLTPSAAVPLFQVDPTTNNVLILTIQYQAPGAQPMNVIRRVAINAQGVYAPS